MTSMAARIPRKILLMLNPSTLNLGNTLSKFPELCRARRLSNPRNRPASLVKGINRLSYR